MPVERRSLGLTRGHERQGPTEATAFTLDNGQMTVTIWDYGAHLISVRVPDRDGKLDEIVVGPTELRRADDPADRGGFRGATVGRYANRIAGSAFELDGVTYQLAANDGPNHLHGGLIGFDQYVWEAEIVAADQQASAVRFTHQSPDGDEGYPGALTASVTFTLTAENRLTLAYAATCDAPTPLSLTNHVYWNLAGGGSVRGHRLQVAADRYVHADDARLPIVDPLKPVDGTRFDFRQTRPLDNGDFGDGYDDCLVLNDPEPGNDAGPAASLHEPVTGRTIEVATDQPGVQLYSANHLLEPYTGVCLETQALPDSPNRPTFPSAVLRPGEIWRSETSFTFNAI